MALSEVQRPGVRVTPVESVGEHASVRHVDQLSQAELHAFLACLDGDSVHDVPLTEGEVIVFTEYFQVEAA